MVRAVAFTVVSLLTLASGFVAPVSAQGDYKQPAPPPSTPAKPSESGGVGRGRVTERVAIGELAPDFEALGLDGKPKKLSRLRGDWVMLVFVERRDSLDSVEIMASVLSQIGVRTVALCYDKPQSIANHLRGKKPSYLPLADPTGEIVALYGLMDPVRDESQPGFVLITPRGDVRMALLGTDLPSGDASRLVQFAVTGE